LLPWLGWSYHSGKADTPPAANVVVDESHHPDDSPAHCGKRCSSSPQPKGKANVLIKTKSVTLKTALTPLMNLHGVRIVAEPAGVEIDAQHCQWPVLTSLR